jgi:hypothetical protein
VSRFAQEIPRLHNLIIDVVDVGMFSPALLLGRIVLTVNKDDLYVPDVPQSWVDLCYPQGRGKFSANDGCAVVNLSMLSARSQGSAPVLAAQALMMSPSLPDDPHEVVLDELWLQRSAAAADGTAPSAPPASSSGGPRSEVGGPKAFALGLVRASDLLDKGILAFTVEFSAGKLLEWLPVRAEESFRAGLKPPMKKSTPSTTSAWVSSSSMGRTTVPRSCMPPARPSRWSTSRWQIASKRVS